MSSSSLISSLLVSPTSLNRRAAITLYSDPCGITSHKVRLMLAEKSITANLIHVDPRALPEDFIDINPMQSLPTLTERDLVLYGSSIIMEYLDERYPHPPLMPVYPIARAKTRFLISQITNEWYRLLSTVLNEKNKVKNKKAREQLQIALMQTLPFFEKNTYFAGEEFSLLDCYILPWLYRLKQAKIKLPKGAKALEKYCEKMFNRRSFLLSLTLEEKKLR